MDSSTHDLPFRKIQDSDDGEDNTLQGKPLLETYLSDVAVADGALALGRTSRHRVTNCIILPTPR